MERPIVGEAFENKSKWTRVAYERARRSYCAAASQAKQNAEEPDVEWFADHLKHVCANRGQLAARKYARYVDHYLSIHGSTDYIKSPRVQAILYAHDDFDVLALDLEPIVGPSPWRRAQQHADDSYTPEYARQCRRWSKAWWTYCESKKENPLDPSPMVFLTWLAEQAKTYKPNTLRNMKNAVSHYLRSNGVEDFTLLASVTRFFEGAFRENKIDPVLPCTPDDRRAMLAGRLTRGAGVRDRVAILLTCFTLWGVEALVLIDVEDCEINETEVRIKSPLNAERLHIARHSERDLDIGYWLEQLVRQVGSGPLFRSVDPYAMGYSENPISPQNLLNHIRSAATSVGIRGEGISDRLRALYEVEKRDVASETIVCHYDGLAKPRMSRSESRRFIKLLHRKRAALKRI